MSDLTILWLRRDLRVFDHLALDAALQHTNVRVIYSDEPPASPFQFELLEQLLGVLKSQFHNLGLELERRPVADIVNANPKHVFVSADYTPRGLRRDKHVSVQLGTGILQAADSPYAVQPGMLKTRTGDHYKVFTPFYKAWSDCGWDTPNLERAGGSAWEHWLDFLEFRLLDYATLRDRPDLDGTSRISQYLSLGALHPRALLETLRQCDTGSPEDKTAFARELAFREFYADFVYHRPDSITENVNPKFVNFQWNEVSEDFEIWKAGITGYPIIDAGMRQLAATGWMHNRVRMLVASFLTKDLHLPWQLGADYFRNTLIDFDEAINQHSWQWCAGTGTDASPYFRIFNPQTQGQRFDPDAVYIRKWVPELADVPANDIHKLRNLPKAYPQPIVDHAAERLDALARYEAVKNSTLGIA
ncbi:MAG: deoxyribodipyrimidine photo-lyase [Corynebacterium sp.]|nr:deoxyribodipyrimidine photo-lyase [Corynebacterium sp.]